MGQKRRAEDLGSWTDSAGLSLRGSGWPCNLSVPQLLNCKVGQTTPLFPACCKGKIFRGPLKCQEHGCKCEARLPREFAEPTGRQPSASALVSQPVLRQVLKHLTSINLSPYL